VLLFSGLFVIVQSFSGHFLPHDTLYLGMDAERLSIYYGGRVTRFMFHDRVAFGGSIMAVGVLYMWLTAFPLSSGRAWAWWLLLFSGIVGFGSFLTYLGFGYLDRWHGVATLLLLPFYTVGLLRSRILLQGETGVKDLFRSINKPGLGNKHQLGILLLQFTGLGLFSAGVTIMMLGMTRVFVPQDLSYMGVVSCGALSGVNERLIPLIAHDRACFGGGLATIGLMIFFIVRRSEEQKSMWEVLFISLNLGFISALFIHFYIGYTITSHIAPAIAGYIIALLALGLTFQKFKGRAI
jgi:hypothetical protein